MVIAAVMLYRLTLLRFNDEATAFRASFYILIFPAAFYTSTAYSESLYLLFAVASFYAMERGRWILAGIFGGLGAATRIVGFIVVAALALGYSLAVRQRRRLVDAGIIGLPLGIAGLAGAMLVFNAQTGDPLAFVRGQEVIGAKELTSPLKALWQGWEVLNWQHIVKGYEENYTTNALNWLAAVLFLILSVATFKTLGPTYGVYMLASLLVPLTFNSGGDRPVAGVLRYSLVLFPGFMLLARWGRHELVDKTIIVVFLLFLGLLTALFLRSWNVAGVS